MLYLKATWEIICSVWHKKPDTWRAWVTGQIKVIYEKVELGNKSHLLLVQNVIQFSRLLPYQHLLWLLRLKTDWNLRTLKVGICATFVLTYSYEQGLNVLKVWPHLYLLLTPLLPECNKHYYLEIHSSA